MYKYFTIVLLAFALSATAKPTNPLFPVTAKDMEPELPMEPHGLMVSSCVEKLQDDYLDCAYQFTANLIGVVGDLITSRIKEARESYEKAQAQLENCKNNANNEYKNCVNNRKNEI